MRPVSYTHLDVYKRQLLSLAVKDGTATISSVKYQGAELLRMYMERILAMIRAEYPGVPVAQLVISLENMEMKLMDCLMGCADALGISRDLVHIASHTECFVSVSYTHLDVYKRQGHRDQHRG